MDKFPNRIKALIEYLNIPVAKFAKNCGFSNYVMVKYYMNGKYDPTLSSIKKIIDRYPVNKNWLVFGDGEMWGLDYFRSEFYTICRANDNYTVSDKIKVLLRVFDCSVSELAKRAGINKNTLQKIVSGEIKSLSDENILKLRKVADFVPERWFRN
ncbi:MAG: helix-turn-helix domain-containing protein [Flavobacteriaceae bacterium]|nr:helix-turn-helix domain-containing protein [Flavobacteriaceae bacterium]